jgi:ferredoxin
MQTIKDPSTEKVKPYIDPDKCVGCGQCVVGCKVEGAVKMELAKDAGAHVPVMGGRPKLPEGIKPFKPAIPRK